MKNNLLLKIFIVLSYIVMITVNYLANALPLGGVTTGQASDSYANLFTPAGITFSIWGLIYALLAVYVVYTIIFIGEKTDKKKEELLKNLGLLFICTSITNITWIFAWHYGHIALSVLIMLVFLITLIKIAGFLNNKKLSMAENICLRLPFSIYFGWITVAAIANITVLLVSINWSGWGISPEVWTILILLVGAIIGMLRAIKDKNIFYMIVFIWAYSGIYLKHYSVQGYSGQYPNILNTLIICLLLYVFTVCFLMYRSKN